MTTQTETKPEAVLFELVTLSGARYRKGALAPEGTVTDDAGTNIPVTVEDFEEVGDWIEVHFSSDYIVGIPQSSIERAVSRSL
jgi:hypothetical protein